MRPLGNRASLPILVPIGLLLTCGLVAAHIISYRQVTLPRRDLVVDLAARLPADRAQQDADSPYVSSDQCRSCHPGEHASWQRSYHRTMTQAALPENVLGSFDGSTVKVDGLPYRVYREGDEFWAEMPDPDDLMEIMQFGKPKPLNQVAQVKRRVVMTTGSHHYQTYWVNSHQVDSVLQTLPMVYLRADQRWIPRPAAFMRPADYPGMYTQWNHHCIQCHSTGGVPGLKKDQPLKTQLQTEVGELGISCEACHGPGRDHVRRHQNPIVRYQQHATAEPDPTIINPARLDHRRSSEICGQCHGVFIRDEKQGMEFAQHGDAYRPGDEVDRFRYYIDFPREDSSAERWAEFRNNRQFYRERWWEDGTMLAGGREYSAIKVSGCYLRGEISCLSCHSMHDSDPVDQLRTDISGNFSCTQCHQDEKYTKKIAEHTHHGADSSGSQCMNCHMPHTTYALLSAIRNHQISSPDLVASIKYGTPNACNLCHLDQTLGWAQSTMADWYGTRQIELSADQQQVAASVLWLLKGNAAQRVIAAWHMRWGPALEASGRGWQTALLAPVLTDPYGVVRYVAHRSLEQVLDRRIAYDFVGRPEDWDAVVRQVRQWSAEQVGSVKPWQRERVLIQADGQPDHGLIDKLWQQRDNSPVSIKE